MEEGNVGRRDMAGFEWGSSTPRESLRMHFSFSTTTRVDFLTRGFRSASRSPLSGRAVFSYTVGWESHGLLLLWALVDFAG